ncbi:tyrosine-type recombinase/integrase [Bosea sp. BIWAKO-01]|uniref:tyrosine-type recombinase/integrase n=1 Tax=Bosea sp. BIWAKO-01 TaxID=506668 RepID=UPI00085396F5|nr:tyrosine-type recombinase/integrase [Bosea sp. BIWAKO-01]GAU82890.1 integrase [Bosea sp. BIWAKO-01]
MPATFTPIEDFGEYSLVRHSNKVYYIAWYDPAQRQTKRRSLKTKVNSDAMDRVRQVSESGMTGDPLAALGAKLVRTVVDLLDDHRDYVKDLASVEAETIHINLICASAIANKRVAALTRRDFEALRDEWVAKGAKISTVSRRLSTLRSAIKRAADNKQLAEKDAPKIPEFRTANHVRAAEPKGDPCGTEALARLYDATEEPHLQVYWAVLFATAGRQTSILELEGQQIDREHSLVDLNPKGRVQTDKYRPVLPILQSLQPWLDLIPQGLLIMWRDKPIASVKTGVRRAIARADLPNDINSYSVRHSLGRFMTREGIDPGQISVWLGHVRPPQNNKTTLIYSPFAPTYMIDARQAVEKFVGEIAARAKTPLLTPPDSVKTYLQRLIAVEKRNRDG